jgi:S-adenosylmethionine/arginine decarboxylase-like enzyme
MIDVVEAAGLTLLSYHCHGMEPTGVSCAGILTHNYIAFHTWPDEGVITFDLVAGGGKSILPVLPVIEERFGVPQAASYHGEAIAQPAVRWAHKLRGFRHDPTKISNLFQMTDLGECLLSILGTEFKEEVSGVSLYDCLPIPRDGRTTELTSPTLITFFYHRWLLLKLSFNGLTFTM